MAVPRRYLGHLEEDIYLGFRDEWVGHQRQPKEPLHRRPRAGKNPLAAVQMGLIYVNPEGPDGHPDPWPQPAYHPRKPIARMAMNDYETRRPDWPVATPSARRIGAADAKHVGPEPEGAPMEEMALAGSTA